MTKDQSYQLAKTTWLLIRDNFTYEKMEELLRSQGHPDDVIRDVKNWLRSYFCRIDSYQSRST
jgi:hypothetical protein